MWVNRNDEAERVQLIWGIESVQEMKFIFITYCTIGNSIHSEFTGN